MWVCIGFWQLEKRLVVARQQWLGVPQWHTDWSWKCWNCRCKSQNYRATTVLRWLWWWKMLRAKSGRWISLWWQLKSGVLSFLFFNRCWKTGCNNTQFMRSFQYPSSTSLGCFFAAKVILMSNAKLQSLELKYFLFLSSYNAVVSMFMISNVNF